jgi:lysophospholipase L1-like esterase
MNRRTLLALLASLPACPSFAIGGLGGRVMNAETTTYAANILAAGGTIGPDVLAAVDDFVTQGKADGWWAQLIDCGLFLGSNLATALVKIVAAPGAGQSYTNNNFVSGDYSVTAGITNTYGAAKWLQTGVIPSSQSLGATNLSYGIGVKNAGTTSSQGILSEYVASGVPTIIAYPFAGIGTVTWTCSYAAAASYFSNGYAAAADGVALQNVMTGATSFSSISTEVLLFKTTKFGATYYAETSLCFAFIGESMTLAQLQSLTLAARRLHIRARGDNSFSTTDLFIGDSISNGQAASNYQTNGWNRLVAAARNANAIQATLPGSTFLVDSGSGLAGVNRLSGLSKIGIRACYIAMGSNDMDSSDVTSNGDPTILSNFRSAMTTACQSLQSQNIRPIVVTPPWNGFATQTKLLAYADAAINGAAAAGASYVDICRPFIATGNAAYIEATYFGGDSPNYVHPNDAGHSFIANIVKGV